MYRARPVVPPVLFRRVAPPAMFRTVVLHALFRPGVRLGLFRRVLPPPVPPPVLRVVGCSKLTAWFISMNYEIQQRPSFSCLSSCSPSFKSSTSCCSAVCLWRSTPMHSSQHLANATSAWPIYSNTSCESNFR